ncbi:MAG: T9SS type A sorting domain-containing protein [Fibrobacter sp.]|nr:T9SS type A sorting domain-containing protein [Fibrobacter sp.]
MDKLKVLVLIFVMQIPVVCWAQSVKIIEAEGWLESVWVKWTDESGADKFSVYYSGESVSNKKIDDCLIRKYGTYWRADIPGLKAGSYTVKVFPVKAGTESAAAETGALTVLAHDRTGFAFDGGRIPGGYKMDGTVKPGAVILYVNELNKDKISVEITGASKNPCTGLQTILSALKKGKETRSVIVRLIGQISDFSVMENGDILVENGNTESSCVTIEGIGDDAVADGWGIRMKNASNVEIRNLAVMNCNSGEGDNIGLQQNNDHVWVHNCDFFYGDAGGDADQTKGDGALDSKKSTFITFSYNHFWDSGKCNLFGNGETGDIRITHHHNWFDHSDSRHPRVRYFTVHVYNNYYDGVSKYGIGASVGSSIFAEGNYFRNCKYPMLISMQGSDVWDGTKNDYSDMPTFSKENGGMIKAFNNFITGETRFVAYGDENAAFNVGSAINSTTDFDAYVVKAKEEKVPGTIKSNKGGNTYNNFDTDQSMYAWTADDPEEAKAKVMKYAGRVRGGDFKWTFDNAVDDISYDVNTKLKDALKSYKTSLVSIQGENDITGISNRWKNNQHKNKYYLSSKDQVKKVEVYNLRGRMVKQISFTNGIGESLHLKALGSGSYIVKSYTSTGVASRRVIGCK